MRAVVIGSNGYFGLNLVNSLKRHGFNVIGCDIGNKNLSGADEYLSIDITNPTDISKLDFDCDAIYVLAGKNGTIKGFEEYRDYILINEVGLLNILSEYVKQGSDAKLIYPSSRLVYDRSSENLKETGALFPKTIYAVNKVACENYLKIYANSFNLRYCIFRIGIPYGGLILDSYPNVTVGFMIKAALSNGQIPLYGGGEQKRSFTNMDYICELFVNAALNSQLVNDIFNIGGEIFSLHNLAEKIAAKTNAKIKNIPWPQEYELIETGDSVLDDSKLKSAININYVSTIDCWLDNEIQKYSERKDKVL